MPAAAAGEPPMMPSITASMEVETWAKGLMMMGVASRLRRAETSSATLGSQASTMPGSYLGWRRVSPGMATRIMRASLASRYSSVFSTSSSPCSGQGTSVPMKGISLTRSSSMARIADPARRSPITLRRVASSAEISDTFA